jgi:hypothetical protein
MAPAHPGAHVPGYVSLTHARSAAPARLLRAAPPGQPQGCPAPGAPRDAGQRPHAARDRNARVPPRHLARGLYPASSPRGLPRRVFGGDRADESVFSWRNVTLY